MEFTLDSPNIQLTVKNEEYYAKKKEYFLPHYEKLNINNNQNIKRSKKKKNSSYSAPCEEIEIEVFLKLEDFYLINNIKLIGELDEVFIKKIKFQNINSGIYECVSYFNPDNYKEITFKESDSLSIFSVGLTQQIKIDLKINNSNVINTCTSNRTLETPENQLDLIENKVKINKNHNQSMHDMRNNEHTNKIKSILRKIVIFSQYIYTIPNSTFLLTLLNLKNYFVNSKNVNYSCENYHYLCSLFLTASSMTQARLFIQSWELFNKLQIYIISNMNESNLCFFKILLYSTQKKEITVKSNCPGNNLNDVKSQIPIFLAKLEIVKSICMYEHGHTLAFLDSLKNCINIFFYNDFSGIKLNISWVKNNEIAADKYYIQNFLNLFEKNIAEILILFLKDKSEIVVVSTLKVIEFVLDNNPSILVPYFSKIMKILLKFLYIEQKFTSSSLFTKFIDRKVFFMNDIYTFYMNKINNKKTSKRNSYSDESILLKNCSNSNSNYSKPVICMLPINNMSPILLKQLNYTLDTMINNLDNLPSAHIQAISKKINNIILSLLKNSETDSILTANLIKLTRKIYENTNSSILELFGKIQNYTHTETGNNIYEYHPEENIMTLISLAINPNSILQFKEFFNSTMQQYNTLKNTKPNTKQKFNIPNINLLETNEMANIVVFLMDKISEDCLFLDQRNCCLSLFEWFISSFEIINSYFLSILSKDYEEFMIFYSYVLLYLMNYLFFQKSEIKSDVYKIFNRKLHPNLLKHLNNFISVIVDIEILSLTNKKCLILFDLIIEIMKNMKKTFRNVLSVDFSEILLTQFENLLKFIQKNGIFNENIYYLLKTLPLIEDNLYNNYLETTLQNIFITMLNNFSNYNNEEMSELFSLFLNKLKNNLNQEIFDLIISAVINKYNYKGNNYKNSCNSLFSIIFQNDKYFEFLKRNILQCIEQYLEFTECNRDKVLNKDFYLEFMEKLEIYKKYIEFIKNEKNFESQFNYDIEIHIKLILKKYENLLLSDQSTVDIFLNLARVNDDSILAKINEILIEDYEFMEIITKFIKFNSNNYNKLNIGNILENTHLIFSNHLNFTSQLFFTTNKLNKNYQLHFENFKIMTKISNLFSTIIYNFSIIFRENENKDNIPEIIPENIPDFPVNNDLIIFKIKFFKSLIDSMNFQDLKKSPLKNNLLEVMNFIETLVIKYNEINTEVYLRDYFSFLIPILNFFLESSDDFQKIFGIEIILKFYNIIFEEGVINIRNNLSNLNNQFKLELNMPISIWDKVIQLSNSTNYKISIFAIYVLQVVAPREEVENLLKNKKELIDANSSVTTHNTGNKFVKFENKFEHRDSNIFMTEEELENLHLFIRDKIIFEFKVRNTIENIENNGNSNVHNHTGYNEELGLNKIDEISDNDINEVNDYIDLIKIPNLDDEDEINSNKKINGSVRVEINNINNKSNKNDKKVTENNKEEYLSLEELGVFEAEDEIFDNFDEDNIPVIKNIYKRKKGSAEKFKTNQNTRNLLMSDHVKKTNECNYDDDKFVNNKIKWGKNKQELINDNEFIDEHLVADLQIKKKNIRPQNGLRPATPPLRPSNTLGSNSKNDTENNFVTDVPLMIRLNNGNNQKDKKYQIKSMEELFLDEEEKNSNVSNVSNLSNISNLSNSLKITPRKNQNIEEDEDVNISYEEHILKSFENLNEEDFKSFGSGSFKADKLKIKIGEDRKFSSSKGIKIKDYEADFSGEDNYLENDYENIKLDYEEQEEEKQNTYKKLSKGNSEGKSTFNDQVCQAHILTLQNKNKFATQKKNNINTSNSITTRPMNNTLNHIVSMTERPHLHLINNQILPHNISANDMNENSKSNATKLMNIKKNIHNLHNMHKNKQATTFRPKDEENKVSSEFRRLLKLKLNKNSERIFANLRKLSHTNSVANTQNNTLDMNINRSNFNNNNSNNIRIIDNEYSRSNINKNISSSTKTFYKNDDELMENYQDDSNSYSNSMSNINECNILNKNKTANVNTNSKKNNYLINTNLTESKYLVSSSNKTPNFNYNASVSKEK